MSSLQLAKLIYKLSLRLVVCLAIFFVVAVVAILVWTLAKLHMAYGILFVVFVIWFLLFSWASDKLNGSSDARPGSLL